MRIARELAGYSMGEADLLRRAMGKNPVQMAKQRETFMKGDRRNVPDMSPNRSSSRRQIRWLRFHKGHAALRAVAYQTAYLKANIRLSFSPRR